MLNYNIDGKTYEIDFMDDIFHEGYNDGIYYMDRRFEDLGKVHDEVSKNPYTKDSKDYITYKAGFIQGAS